MSQPSNEMAVAKDKILTDAHGLVLRDFDAMWRFAVAVVESRLAPDSFKTPAAVLIALQSGAELGLSPMASLRGFAVVNGKATLYGDALKAVVLASPVCEWVKEWIEGEGDKLTACCQSKRRGCESNPITRFSVEDAKIAKLWGKRGPWETNPKRMLQMRARGFDLRDNFADLLCGMITAEEARDYETKSVVTSGDTVAPTDLDQLAEQVESGQQPVIVQEDDGPFDGPTDADYESAINAPTTADGRDAGELF